MHWRDIVNILHYRQIFSIFPNCLRDFQRFARSIKAQPHCLLIQLLIGVSALAWRAQRPFYYFDQLCFADLLLWFADWIYPRVNSNRFSRVGLFGNRAKEVKRESPKIFKFCSILHNLTCCVQLTAVCLVANRLCGIRWVYWLICRFIEFSLVFTFF